MKNFLINDTPPIAAADAKNIAVGAVRLTIAIATNVFAPTAKKNYWIINLFLNSN
jgi:hypothetical protein